LNSISLVLNTTNISVKNKADILIDLIIDTVECSCLVNPLSQLALYSNVRSKAAIITHL